MERIGRTHCEQLKLRTTRYLSRSGRSERHANVGLIGGNVVSTGDDGARAIRLERGRADTEPTISEAEWHVRRPHRQSAGREHRVDNLPQRGAIDACELHTRIQGNSIGTLFGVDAGGGFTAADSALDRVKAQYLAIALQRAADRAQLGTTRQHAAQSLKNDAAAPAFQQPGT